MSSSFPSNEFKIQTYDALIRFRSLNRDQNYIFIKNKNSIQVLEPIKLVHIYSFHHNETIIDFVVSPKDSALILCSSSSIEKYKLLSPNLSDYNLKIKYELYKTLSIENIMNLSVSTLGDVIACITKHRNIQLFDNDLNIIKNLNTQVSLLPANISLFPLGVFQITYDTKNIIICKYNYNKLSFIYKHSKDINGDSGEFGEKVIALNENVIYLKEYQKPLSMYLNYRDSSVFFILTRNFNFLIVRKVFETDPDTYDLIPTISMLLYIDLSPKTSIDDFNSISFSLLYDNENPLFKSESININAFEELQSAIFNNETWESIACQNTNTLSENEMNTFLNYNEYYHKTISKDYIIFNFAEGVCMYKIDGLQSVPFNNPSIDEICDIIVDKHYDNLFVLLKATKTIDRKYSLFFMDKYVNIRKYHIKDEIDFNNNANGYFCSKVSITDSNRAFTLYRHIVYAEYNEKNKKTIVYEQQGNDSLIAIINSKLEFTKMIVFPEQHIHNVHWIRNSNFIMFSYTRNKNDKTVCIGIINIYSKLLNDDKITFISHEVLKKSFISIIPSKIFNTNITNLLQIFLESPYSLSNDIIDDDNDNDKDITSTHDYNDVQCDVLLKTDNYLIYCNLLISNNNNNNSASNSNNTTTSGNEYTYTFTKQWIYSKNNFSDVKNWQHKEFISENNNVYYSEYDNEYLLFNINEIDSVGDKKTIFQTTIFKDLLYVKNYYNNYIIFITNHYINTYDIHNRTFYRVRNDYVKVGNEYSIDLFKCGIYICVTFLNSRNVYFVRVPRNKNNNESFYYEFKYTFDISKTFAKISLQNDMVIFNESQLENLNMISKIKHNLLFESNQQELLLLHSNANSLFDCETFLDLFLCDNEEAIKFILNTFCKLYPVQLDLFIEPYKNSKLIPNFLESNAIDNISKLLFEYELNIVSSEVTSSNEKTKLIKFDNPHLVFKQEEDDQSKNPISKWCSQSSNLIHIKTIYDIISNEDTRNLDHLTKYLMIKIKSKFQDFKQSKFKMSTADLCWISLINNQEDILKFICKDKISTMTWELMTTFNIPFWLKSDIKLKELLEHVAKNEYKRLLREEMKLTDDKTHEKNYTEHIALYFYLADKQKLLEDFYDREPHNTKIKNFIMRNFSDVKNRRSAKQNADALMNKKKYIYATFFYLLADDIRSALDMTLEKMGDINLTICILRLVESKYGNDSWKKYYSLDKIYQNFCINFGTVIRDPWLVTFGYMGQKKIDNALEYLLNYDLEYTFDKNKEIFDNIDEYKYNLETIRKVFAMTVFDYKILIFAKNLEKLYLTKLNESQNEVKNVENTNFEDLWDMDGDDDFGYGGGSSNNNNQSSTNNNNNETSIKNINIDYKSLTSLCVINALKRGALFAPIFGLYKVNHNNSFSELPLSTKEILKNLICDRVVLDMKYATDKNKSSKTLFDQIDNFFTYLEQNKLLTKKELYSHINTGFLFLNEYQYVNYSCTKSETVRDSLIWITNYTERLIYKNIYALINFNFYENINLNKIQKISSSLRFILIFLRRIEEYTKDPLNKKNNSNNEFYQNEKNLYVFRIIFMLYFYYLFAGKVIQKYSIVNKIYKQLKQIVTCYKYIEKFDQTNSLNHIAKLEKYCYKVEKRIKKTSIGAKELTKDESISFYIQFLNYAICNQLKVFLYDNKSLKTKQLTVNETESLINKDHYFHEEFIFVNVMSSYISSFVDNFEKNMEKYLQRHMRCDQIYHIHNELKNIYMLTNTNSQRTNYFKYGYINIRQIFSKENNLYKFEELFNFQDVITVYLSHLCKFFTYVKKTQDDDNDNGAGLVNDDNENDKNETNVNVNVGYSYNSYSNITRPQKTSSYSKASINIVKEIFSKGYEISVFNEGTNIQDFAINNCDISNFAVSTVDNGHRKIHILKNLLENSRTPDFFKLNTTEPDDNWEKIYSNSFNRAYEKTVTNLLKENYKEILSIVNHDIIKKKQYKSQFPMQCVLPPHIFNEIQSDEYLEDISLNTQHSNYHCKVIESHPQLPLYITSNKQGIVGLWSFSYEKNKSLDEFYIEKISKDSSSSKSNLNITRMHFNAYGNDFLACTQAGDLYLWSFEHIKNVKLPKIPLRNELFYSKDACYLNNTGIIVSTNNKSERHKSMLWDLLYETKKGVGSVDIGGNLVLPYSKESGFVVANDKPGTVSFVDVRKMEVVQTYLCHDEEIKSIKISPREQFMVTFGKDSIVKIWDLSDKSELKLVESISPFGDEKRDKKSRYNIKIASDFLFASKDNVIKMLRNKII